MTATSRDDVWALALQIARGRSDRGYLEAFAAETVITAARDDGLETSARTVRRVLHAMTDTGVLEQLDDDPLTYRLTPQLEGSSAGSSARTPAETAGRRPDDTSDAASPASWESAADLGRDPLAIDSDVLIYHLWADTGVEAEPLSAYGTVVRVGLDPDTTGFSLAVQGDATQPPLEPGADLAVCHPPCQRWSTLTSIDGDPSEWPDQLDDARHVASRLAEDYIIENVPQAPLEDPVTLDGRQFGLPIRYRRSFETTFHVPQPPASNDTIDNSGPFASETGGVGDWRGPKLLWRAAKQVSGDYPAEPLKHSGIPAPYIHYLARWWLRSRPDLLDLERDDEPAPATQEVPADD